jgi:hypothetical protein
MLASVEHLAALAIQDSPNISVWERRPSLVVAVNAERPRPPARNWKLIRQLGTNAWLGTRATEDSVGAIGEVDYHLDRRAAVKTGCSEF